MTTAVLVAGFGMATVIAACATEPPSPAPTPLPSVALPTLAPTASPSDTPVPTPSHSPTAADLPKIDPVTVFGRKAKLTGSEDEAPGEQARGAVLALTSGHFAFAVECIGAGPLTVTVTRPNAEPDADGSMDTVLATSSVACPTSALQTFEYDTADPGPKTSLNIGGAEAPTGVYWRLILVDLEP
jgi:hypothetical protein